MRIRWRGGLATFVERLAPALAIGAIVIVWEIVCRVFQIPEFLLPAPSSIVRAALHTSSGQWISNISSTLVVAVSGYLAAIAIAVPLAIVLALSRLLSRTIFPILVVIHSTPIVAVAPIIVVNSWRGYSPPRRHHLLNLFLSNSNLDHHGCPRYARGITGNVALAESPKISRNRPNSTALRGSTHL